MSLRKNNFYLRVQTLFEFRNNLVSGFDEGIADTIEESYGSDANIITAWWGEFMVDQHITGMYPELEDIGVLEECEGFMVSSDGINKDDLKAKLKKMGFSLDRKEITEISEEEYVNSMEYDEEEFLEESRVETLQRELEKAVKEENYMEAAKIRDQIAELKSK